MEKEAHLQKIIQAQHQFLFAFFGVPALIFLAALLVGERFAPLFIAAWFAFAAWSGIKLRSVDLCPWCGFSFLEKNSFWRLGMGGISIPPRKCCINCGAPGHKSVAKP